MVYMQTLVLDLLPQAPTALLFLPEAAVQACLPYWLEAAAWAVALMSDGTAAAMGRLPVTQREGAANRPFEGDEVRWKPGNSCHGFRCCQNGMHVVASYR